MFGRKFYFEFSFTFFYVFPFEKVNVITNFFPNTCFKSNARLYTKVEKGDKVNSNKCRLLKDNRMKKKNSLIKAYWSGENLFDEIEIGAKIKLSTSAHRKQSWFELQQAGKTSALYDDSYIFYVKAIHSEFILFSNKELIYGSIWKQIPFSIRSRCLAILSHIFPHSFISFPQIIRKANRLFADNETQSNTQSPHWPNW